MKNKIFTITVILCTFLAANAQWTQANSEIPVTETDITPEIEAMARALKYDAVEIFKYVHNEIDYVATYGIYNGATGCLLAGRGNDWDQSALLIALLRASGFQARFATAKVAYPEEAMEKWLNIDDPSLVKSALTKGGHKVYGVEDDVDLLGKMAIWRVYVELFDTDSNDWLVLDPAFKEYEHVSGIDLEAAMGYQANAFITQATTGATIQNGYIEHVNEALIQNQLITYATNLAYTLRNNYPNVATDEIIGGYRIKKEDFTEDLPIGLPGYSFLYPETCEVVDQIPDWLHLKVRIVHEGVDETLKGYEIAGKRIMMFYDQNDGNKPQLRVDGNLIAEGTGTMLGLENDCIVSVGAPVIGGDQGYYTDSHRFDFISGGRYLVAHDFESGSKKITESHNRGLLEAQFANATPDSEEIVGGGMQITMDSGLEAWHSSFDLLAELADVRLDLYYFIGVLGLTGQGYYVDIPMAFFGITPRTTDADNTSLSRAAMFLESGLEHGILEQSQGSDRDSVSTIKLIQINNSEEGKTYLATSANWSSVRSSLVNYPKLQHFDAAIAAGYVLLLPQDGSIDLLDWSGSGYAQIGDDYIFMMIDKYHGGYSADYDSEFSVADSQLNLGSMQLQHRDVNLNIMATTDPIDLHTGDFLYDRTDLSFDALSFSRHYNSGQAGKNGPLGYGWTHGYEISARKASHSAPALGARRAEDAASLIVAGTVLLDLLEGDADVARWTTAILTSKWGVDQLIENAVYIQLGPASLEYIRHPDGSYSPPPGETADLVRDNDHFVLQKRFGEQLVFNPDGTIASWTDADDKGLSFGYNSSTNLQTVSDSYGRSLTLGYTDGLLTSVTDSSGRSVGYGYSDGNLISWTDAESEVWRFDYTDTNNPHLLTVLTDPMNQITASNSYNSLGQVETQRNGAGEDWEIFVSGNRGIEQDPEGGMMQYFFDENGRCISTENELHIVDSQFYDAEGHPILKIDPKTNLTSFEYDANHNLTNRVDAENNKWNFTYDAAGHLTDEINPLGQTTHFDYDTNHHLWVVTDPLSGQTVRTYYETGTSKGLIHTLTDPNGNVTTYTYDSYGNPDVVTYPDMGPVDYDYNVRGELCKQTDARGNETTYSYNGNGKLLATQYQDGSIVGNSYWPNGLLRQTVDAKGQSTSYTWTPTYKLETVTYPNGGVVSNHYDSRDWLVAVTDMRGHTVSNLYDIAGRNTGIEDGLGYLTEFQMDQSGNITNTVVDPEGLALWTARTFDDLNHPAIIQTSLSRIENQYNALSQVTNRIDAANKAWVTEYDALGRVRKTFRPSGNYEEYGYDANGNRTHFWNAEAKPMTFGFDAQGRIASITNAINKITNFGYDGAGNLAWRVMPDQDVTSYGYDGMNRLVAVTNQGSVVSSLGYDRNGNTVAHASPLASGSLGYDAMNHLIASTQTVNSATAIVRYGYDLNGNRTNIVYPGGLTVGYVHGANDRIEHVTTTYGGNTKTFSFSYDSANRLDGISYPNGVNSSFGLDAEGRVTSIVHGNFINRTIQRNALGFKNTELIDAGLKPTIPTSERRIKTHNDADQLVSERIQSGGGWTDAAYGYNANGCLTSSVSSASSVVYQYDYDNRIVSTTEGTENTEYLYDASGSRIGRIHNSVTNYFVVDYGDALKRPLAETDTSGNVLRFYVWSGSQLLCHIDANGTVRYYHSDELGSTLALTDASGNVTDQFAYIPYGYATHTGSTQTPFQWLGGYGVYYDSDTDLHLTLHRAYSAKMKRFIHPDPLGIDGGANVYMWANMNPLAFVDPYGLSAFDWFSNGLSFVGGALQVAAGFTIAATTSWSGIGAYAGAALMVQGGSSMVASAVNMNNLRQGNDPGLNASGAIGLTTSLIFDDPKINAVASGLDVVVNVASGRVGLDAAKKVLLAKAAPGTVTRTVVDTTRFGTLSKTTNTSSEDLVKPIISVPTWQKGITRTGVGFTVAGAIMDNVKCY